MADIENNAIEENNSAENEDKKEGNVLAGFVLYTDANMDWARFKKYLREDWDINADNDEVKDNVLVFNHEGMIVACSLMPNPVPDHEAEENAKHNIMWKEGAEEAAKHNAHVMLAIMNKFDAMEQATLFIKVASCLLKLDNAIGIYKHPTVYQKQFYIDFAEAMKKDQMPVPILIFLGVYYTGDGALCAFTQGMRYFGKEELEVVDCYKQPQELIGFMYAIAEYCLSEDVELKDGETIGFSEDEKLPISVGKGVSIEGDSIKIGY